MRSLRHRHQAQVRHSKTYSSRITWLSSILNMRMRAPAAAAARLPCVHQDHHWSQRWRENFSRQEIFEMVPVILLHYTGIAEFKLSISVSRFVVLHFVPGLAKLLPSVTDLARVYLRI